MTQVQVSLHSIGFIGHASHLQVVINPTAVSGVILDSGTVFSSIGFSTSSFSQFTSGMGNPLLGTYVWRIATWSTSSATPVIVNVGPDPQAPATIAAAAALGPVMPPGTIEYFKVQSWNETVAVIDGTIATS